MKKKITIFFLLILILVFFFIFFKSFREDDVSNLKDEKISDNKINANIIKDVNYTSRDSSGNEYILNASEGEIDLKNTDIIFLKNVKAIIKFKNNDKVIITSDYGKYNIENYDTIFNENVVAVYLDNKITSKYLDFSLVRNSMIITKDVVFTNSENTLKADVIEMDLETKDSKIFMFDNKKKVNIKNKINGNN